MDDSMDEMTALAAGEFEPEADAQGRGEAPLSGGNPASRLRYRPRGTEILPLALPRRQP